VDEAQGHHLNTQNQAFIQQKAREHRVKWTRHALNELVSETASVGDVETALQQAQIINDRCYFCGGRLSPALTTLPFVIGSSVVVVKQVAADVCTQCGEAVMSSDVAAAVDGLLKQAYNSGFEVSIVPFRQPEMAMA
jgi:YgiT-type zinc finger domain-containing protein